MHKVTSNAQETNSSQSPKYHLTSELNKEIGTDAIANIVLKSQSREFNCRAAISRLQ